MPTFSKTDRLVTQADFQRVYDRKCSSSNSWLIVYACPNDLGHSRIGLSVSRKIGNAVVRNRFKRLFREAFRLSRAELPVGLDLILIPRSHKGMTACGQARGGHGREPSLETVRESLRTLVGGLARRLARAEKS